MTRFTRLLISAALALSALAGSAWARGLGVDVWTDRGDDAVYQPGEALQVKVRANDDAYLLVYSIGTEGDVTVIWPLSHGRGQVEGRRTYRVPPESADFDLVTDEDAGQGYLVAIASRRPFRSLPWYLRSFDLRGEELGYDGYDDDDENDGVTREGHIVGDPFVAMERIRRRVLQDPDDESSFATGYSQYYVHQPVRYPRYVCYDCHRPGRWAWWDGFDPYYARCSVFDFRVNWSWSWGPTCWSGYVPYYYYVVRSDCPPGYRRWWGGGHRWSSWDGWRRWDDLWGTGLRRYKTPPPAGYVPPPPKGQVWRAGDPTPPGFVSNRNTGRGGPGSGRTVSPIGRPMSRPPGEAGGSREPQYRGDSNSRVPKPGVERRPGAPESPRGEGVRGRPRSEGETPSDDSPRRSPGGERQPAPRQESPRYEPPRKDNSGERQPAPRQESPRYEPPRKDNGGDRQPAPKQESPRYDPPRKDNGGERAPAPKQEAPRNDPPRKDSGSDRGSSRDEAPRGKGGR